ncbi:MAG TPA: hypothetical protein VLN45_08205 [Ignavibacteriaceae bacterium]|nr:hypothetical protein [Ignavibacteriaceae bacterium]
MKYQKGTEIICIKNQPNFIKGKSYKIEDVYEKEFLNGKSIVIELKDEQGRIQIFEGSDKTKFFKIPRPEGVPVTPPPTPKSKEQKLEEKKQKKLDQEIQAKEWKKVKKLKVKDKGKRIIRRAVGF